MCPVIIEEKIKLANPPIFGATSKIESRVIHQKMLHKNGIRLVRDAIVRKVGQFLNAKKMFSFFYIMNLVEIKSKISLKISK
jgi:hypothetical protein